MFAGNDIVGVINIEDEMQRAYIDYSMVSLSAALQMYAME